jgi:hypothetical protein
VFIGGVTAHSLRCLRASLFQPFAPHACKCMTQELFECIRTAVELSVDVLEEFPLRRDSGVADGVGENSFIGAVCARAGTTCAVKTRCREETDNSQSDFDRTESFILIGVK